MRVLLVAQSPPQVASSRTRVFAYLPYLERAGIAYDVVVWNSERFVARAATGRVSLGEHARNLLHHLRAGLAMLRRSRASQTIFIQKVIVPGWFLRLLKGGRRRLIFDYDDALYALPPGRDGGVRALVRRRRVRRFTNCLRESDLVILENEPNREFTEHYCRDTLTITGPIDAARYHPRARAVGDGPVVLGWIGSPSTTGYLRLLEPALAELARRRRPIVLHLIGAGAWESPHVRVRHVPWTLDGEVDALGTFDIGLMPLTDDAWARGKGGYKILQYMAMGIPTVASPVGINRRMLRDGETGVLASGADEWVAALDRLVTDAPARRRMGASAREDAVARYSLEHYAPAFLQALRPGGGQPAASSAPAAAHELSR
ncbi:MAG: glycosyltransferase family 4 protein [Candidatus Rokubacteria bacterium]|nr:glycosyltransferase family 4 protein [Candidatus Rokubacteria bacterium]